VEIRSSKRPFRELDLTSDKGEGIPKVPSIRDFEKTVRLSLDFLSWEPPLRVCTPHPPDAFGERLVDEI
jgi:hypothetical protein